MKESKLIGDQQCLESIWSRTNGLRIKTSALRQLFTFWNMVSVLAAVPIFVAFIAMISYFVSFAVAGFVLFPILVAPDLHINVWTAFIGYNGVGLLLTWLFIKFEKHINVDAMLISSIIQLSLFIILQS